jgi:regulator of protease activity HflC (stomatin/prohibitin superfamily)
VGRSAARAAADDRDDSDQPGPGREQVSVEQGYTRDRSGNVEQGEQRPAEQKTAEQERRQARLQATGRKEAAEQDKEATILVAEGRSQSILLVAEADAKAIRLVSEAANEYFKENAQINKKLDVIRDTFANQTKIIVPSNSDVLNVLGLEGTPILPLKKTSGEAAK